MPEIMAEFPKSRRGRAKKYDFSEQMDGSTWVIVQGTDDEVAEGVADFTCAVPSIRAHLYREVKENDMALRSTETEHNGRPALAFQVIPEDEAPRRRKNDATEVEDNDEF